MPIFGDNQSERLDHAMTIPVVLFRIVIALVGSLCFLRVLRYAYRWWRRRDIGPSVKNLILNVGLFLYSITALVKSVFGLGPQKYLFNALIAFTVVGVGLVAWSFKKWDRTAYGIVEVVFAAGSAIAIAFAVTGSSKPIPLVQALGLVTSAYVVARGCENATDGMKNRDKFGPISDFLYSYLFLYRRPSVTPELNMWLGVNEDPVLRSFKVSASVRDEEWDRLRGQFAQYAEKQEYPPEVIQCVDDPYFIEKFRQKVAERWGGFLFLPNWAARSKVEDIGAAIRVLLPFRKR
jgi:hypothetical protein